MRYNLEAELEFNPRIEISGQLKQEINAIASWQGGFADFAKGRSCYMVLENP